MSTTHQRIERNKTPYGRVRHKETRRVANPTDHATTVTQRVINFTATLIISVLGLRFLFALFGANEQNLFVNTIYGVTAPIVAPFQNMFNVDTAVRGSRFEIETLVAILVVGILAVILSNFVGIFSSREEVTETKEIE
jgi:ABC-type thiamin/hydroxymethylpyrimidine transport system permease subunit